MTKLEKCPKCGCDQFVDLTSGREFVCFTLILNDGTTYDGNQCLRTQRDQLASQVVELYSALSICLFKLEAVSIHTCPEAIAAIEKHKPIP